MNMTIVLLISDLRDNILLGENVSILLYSHNLVAYQKLVEMLAKNNKAAVIHPTGTGKSYIAFKLIEDNPNTVFLWLAPSEYIFRTQVSKLSATSL